MHEQYAKSADVHSYAMLLHELLKLFRLSALEMLGAGHAG